MNGEGRAGDFDLDRLITISMDLAWFNLKQEFLVNLCFVTHTHTHTQTHTHTTNGLTGFYTTLEAPCLHELTGFYATPDLHDLTGFYAMPEAQQVTHTHDLHDLTRFYAMPEAQQVSLTHTHTHTPTPTHTHKREHKIIRSFLQMTNLIDIFHTEFLSFHVRPGTSTPPGGAFWLRTARKEHVPTKEIAHTNSFETVQLQCHWQQQKLHGLIESQ